eukprot:scaffold195200_cov25-Prasinocladus_malaysianus.AAC.1
MDDVMVEIPKCRVMETMRLKMVAVVCLSPSCQSNIQRDDDTQGRMALTNRVWKKRGIGRSNSMKK